MKNNKKSTYKRFLAEYRQQAKEHPTLPRRYIYIIAKDHTQKRMKSKCKQK